MKTIRLTISFIIILVLGIGCAGVKPGITDKEPLEVRLIKRMKVFQEALYNNDKEKLWEMRSASFKKNFNKGEYFEYLSGGDYLTDYESKEYTFEGLDIKDLRAKVTLRHSTREFKESEPRIYRTYNYWYYENGNWFLAERGLTGQKSNWMWK